MEKEINYEVVGDGLVLPLPSKKEKNMKLVMSKEEMEELEYAIQKCVTLPNLLFRTAKKYDISLSDAIKEGVYLMLLTNEKFIESDDNYEKTLRNKGIYATQRDKFVNTIQKLTGAK